MPGVARFQDLCAMHNNPNTEASTDTFVNGRGVHRKGDKWGNCAPGVILAEGSATVFANGKAVGRCNDPISEGLFVLTCSEDTFAGDEATGSDVTIKAISVIDAYIEAAKADKIEEDIYVNKVTTAAGKAYTEIQEYKKEVVVDPETKPNPEYVLSCKLGDTGKFAESGNKGALAISPGKGDPGGVSYGSYQLNSQAGMSSPAALFVKQSPWSSDFVGLLPGTTEFSSKWLEVVARDKETFEAEEYKYCKKVYYDDVMAQFQSKGFTEDNLCFGLKELVWSTSVQHGPTGCARVFKAAGVNRNTMTNNEIIDAIYKEKSKVDIWFQKSDARNQQGVLKRFVTERLQNIDSCNNEPCDEVPQGIENATMDDLMKIKADKDISSRGKEDYPQPENGRTYDE